MLKLGNLNLQVPVILSPMADYTNLPYRLLCSQHCASGLFIEEMVSSKAIVNSKKRPLEKMVDTSDKETIRSVQLYVFRPQDTYEAIAKILEADLADHIDLNFGCPVRKVTRIGSGSAIPWKQDLYTEIVKQAKAACGDKVPLTVKLRLGIDDAHMSYLEAGKIAEGEGAAAVILHCRTTAQYYHGTANWEHISKLKQQVKIPVIGNGDVIQVADFIRMQQEFGADGVAIGRGALGRPWIFGQISDYVLQNEQPKPISVKELFTYIDRHYQLMLEYCHFDQALTIKLLRKFYIYYFKGLNIGGPIRDELMRIKTFTQQQQVFNKIIDKCGLDTVVNENFIRGRQGNMHKVYLPDNWLDSNKFFIS